MIVDSQYCLEFIHKTLKKGEKAQFKCEFCRKPFFRSKREIKSNLINKLPVRFCSNKCKTDSANTSIEKPCKNCNKITTRVLSQYLKSKTQNVFCSSSCAASYNNVHKKHGTRRSKLEIYLESQIRKTWPELKCLYNDKSVINSELDFYFPQLKLAIELNGIFHYEPIYGQKKFEQIQNNDQQKFKACHLALVELAIVDASKCKYMTQEVKDKFWNIFCEIIEPLLTRLN